MGTTTVLKVIVDCYILEVVGSLLEHISEHDSHSALGYCIYLAYCNCIVTKKGVYDEILHEPKGNAEGGA